MANVFRCSRVCSRHFLRKPVCLIPRRFEQHSIEKEPMKTTVSFTVDVKDKSGVLYSPPYVTSYSTRGFHIKGIKVFGSVAILPSAFYHWRVTKPEDITPESLALFTIMEPPIEIVVLGTGDKILRIDPEIQSYLKKRNILLEVQDTANATATFNFLLEEQRLVGGAFIPPRLLEAE